jgi:hypothetical protein
MVQKGKRGNKKNGRASPKRKKKVNKPVQSNVSNPVANNQLDANSMYGHQSYDYPSHPALYEYPKYPINQIPPRNPVSISEYQNLRPLSRKKDDDDNCIII